MFPRKFVARAGSFLAVLALLALTPSVSQAACGTSACCKTGIFSCNVICTCNNCDCPHG